MQGNSRFSFCDREGNLWVCTQGGLLQLTPSPIAEWQMDIAERDRQVYSVGQDGDGTMWFAAEGGIYFLPQGAPWVQRAAGTPKWNDWLLVGAPGSGALIWGPDGRLNLWGIDGHLEELVFGERGGTTSPNAIRSPNGSILLANESGLLRITETSDGEYSTERLVGVGEGARFYCNGVTESESGDVYIAPPGFGLAKLEPDNPVAPVTEPRVATESRTLKVDAEGRVWSLEAKPERIGCWDGERWSEASVEELGRARSRWYCAASR